MDDIKNSKPGQAYKILKRLGARPGENPEDGSFELPQHVKDGLSATQSADVFAAISQEFSLKETGVRRCRTCISLDG